MRIKQRVSPKQLKIKNYMEIEMRALPLIAVCLLATSCGVCRRPQAETATRDSVVVIKKDSLVLRDSVVFVELPKESQSVETFRDSSHLETSLAFSDAVVRDGILKHTLENKLKRYEVPIQVPERYIISEASASYKQVIREVVEVEKELTWWQRFRMSVGSITLIVAAAWIVFKFIVRE